MAPIYEAAEYNSDEYQPTTSRDFFDQYDEVILDETGAYPMDDNYYGAAAEARAGSLPSDNGAGMESITDFEKALIRISFLAGYVYMLLAVTGILLNAYVIARLIQLALNDYVGACVDEFGDEPLQERFKHGCGLPLAAMSMSDLWSLVSIIAAVVLSGFVPPSMLSQTVHSAHCKITIYLIHALTGFSTWCWLFISALRYIAVYHPLWHITGSALGKRAVLMMLLFVLLINGWLPIVVVSSPESRSCEEQPLSMGADWNRIFHGLELCWSYILPAVLTLALDFRVILVRPPSFIKMAQRKAVADRTKTPLPLQATLSDGWSQAEDKIKGLCCFSRCSQRVNKTPRISIVHEDDRKMKCDNPNRLSTVGRSRTLTNSTYAGHSSAASSLSMSSCGLPRTVAYTQYSWQSTCSQTAGSTKRGRKTVRRWLAITTVHLLLNAPDSLYRLANVIDSTPSPNSPASHLMALIVRLLYFAQFCFNAAYLTAIVYKRNVRPKPRQTTPKHSTAFQQSIRRHSRPHTRVGIRDESRRQSRRHQELCRRYSVDPRAATGSKYLNTNSFLTAPLVPSYSTETFRSEELDLTNNSLGSQTIVSSRSHSTEPRNEIAGKLSSASSDRTSAGINGMSMDVPDTPSPSLTPSRALSVKDELAFEKDNRSGNTTAMRTKSWRV